MTARFMETQVTEREQWIRYEDRDGSTVLIPSEYYEAHSDHAEVEKVWGYGVRESAPGYLDCTEWTVYDTLEEAEKAAKEIDESYSEWNDDDRLRAGD